MKVTLTLLCLILLEFGFCLRVTAQGSAFTYQGRLDENGVPATGFFDFQFVVFDAVSGGTQQGATRTTNGLPVTNGLFTATINPGVDVFSGGARWLFIRARRSGDPAYTSLTPLQPITPAPYAIFAGSASTLSGSITPAQLPASVVTNGASGLSLSGSFSGNGANVTGVNAAALGGLSSAGFWQTSGNSEANPTNGAFLGTADNLPLELRVNGSRALKIEPSPISPNIIGGYSGNIVSNGVVGAFIGGGGNASFPNRAGDYASVVGGVGNEASAPYATAMGFRTSARGFASTAMGQATVASGNSAVAMGGASTSSGFASVAMGQQTTASGTDSVAMGTRANALHSGSYVWGDFNAAPFSSTSTNQYLIRASGGVGIRAVAKSNFRIGAILDWYFLAHCV